MNPKTSRVAVNFILEAIVKAARRTIDQIREDFKSDPHIPIYIHHPDGGKLMISREAHKRLVELAKQFLEDDPSKKDVTDLDKFVPLVGTELVRTFILEDAKVTIENIEPALAKAYEILTAKHEAITHYIPCAAMSSDEAKRFKIGPVEFVPQKEFFDELAEELENYPELAAKRGAEALAAWQGADRSRLRSIDDFRREGQKFAEAVKSYYEQFSWVVVVQVPPCSKSVSQRKAAFAARGALNIIKLLLGASASDRMCIAEDSADPLRFQRLARGEDGELQISGHWRLNGNPVKGHWDDLLQSEGRRDVVALNRLFEIVVGSPRPPYLCEKFFRALSWFGDAVTEPSPGPRIVKFVSAIESIVGTGKAAAGEEEVKVTTVVVSRASCLYGDAMGIDRKAAEKKMNEIYNWRSGLVHGSLSFFDESLARKASETADVTRMILLMGLSLYECVGLDDASFNDERLKQAYVIIANQAGEKGALPSADEAGPSEA
ncbi:hypothetical protein [Luteolibacter sp. Populi]|uniref:hypothetical protein n=1 Tax=Luteolibacter sp. Populi TaxID=3230487 RepID=UPI0034669F22